MLENTGANPSKPQHGRSDHFPVKGPKYETCHGPTEGRIGSERGRRRDGLKWGRSSASFNERLITRCQLHCSTRLLSRVLRAPWNIIDATSVYRKEAVVNELIELKRREDSQPNGTLSRRNSSDSCQAFFSGNEPMNRGPTAIFVMCVIGGGRATYRPHARWPRSQFRGTEQREVYAGNVGSQSSDCQDGSLKTLSNRRSVSRRAVCLGIS